MNSADRDAADAKLERAKELEDEIDEHMAEVRRKAEEIDRLLAEVGEILE